VLRRPSGISALKYTRRCTSWKTSAWRSLSNRGRGEIPCSCRRCATYSLLGLEKFPVRLHREFRSKHLNWLVNWTRKLQRRPEFGEIPCKFPCYPEFGGGDWYASDCVLSHATFIRAVRLIGGVDGSVLQIIHKVARTKTNYQGVGSERLIRRSGPCDALHGQDESRIFRPEGVPDRGNPGRGAPR
jgi:hypothetical protein